LSKIFSAFSTLLAPVFVRASITFSSEKPIAVKVDKNSQNFELL